MSNPLLYILKKNKKLDIYHGSNIYESRGILLEKMIREADKNVIDSIDYTFLINTDDRPLKEKTIEGIKSYSFSTITDDYSSCCPCYIFAGWPEVGFDDYSLLISSFVDREPSTNKVGWIGSPMTYPRQIFHQNFSDTYFSESIVNEWNRLDPKFLHKHTKTYLTFQQQIDRWKYFIDFEGAGYSGRTKILLNSPRIVFIVDRPYKEFWHQNLIAWKHYIPIKRDLSDLEENYNKIESDNELQKYILQEQKSFSKNYLQHANAISKFQNIIEDNIYA